MRLTPHTGHRLRFPLPRAGFGALAAAMSLAILAPAPLTNARLQTQPVVETQLALETQPVGLLAQTRREPVSTAWAPAVVRPDPVAVAVAAATGPPGPAQLGIAVLDRRTGRLALGRLGAVPFLSASVVKLVTAVDVLRRAEVGAGTVSPAQRTLIRRALSSSDDGAMNALWTQFGGSRTVTELAGWAHLLDIRAPAPGAQWAETKLSARDVISTYTYVFASLNPGDRKFVLDSLRAAAPRGADGFDQSFGMLAPPRRPGVAAKQGWMTLGPSMYLHSTGLIGTGDRYVVAVLTKSPMAAGFPGGRAAVTAAVTRVLSALPLTAPAHPPAARPPTAHAPAAKPPLAKPPLAKSPARPAPRHVPYPVLHTIPPRP